MNRRPLTAAIRRKPSQTGFSFIEVLVTMIIVAIALLGTASLQLQAMRTNQAGKMRTAAITLSTDIVERLVSNKVAAITGAYAVDSATTPAATTNCDSSRCTPAQLATFDLARWKQQIATLPGGSGAIVTATAGNPYTYTIVVTWQDRRDKSTYDAAQTGNTETFAYTTGITVASN